MPNKGPLCPAAKALNILQRVILMCTDVLHTHQWGHHPFARWRNNNPEVWFAASHSHVPSRGWWRLGGHDFTQAIAAGCAEDAWWAPGVNETVPCRGAQQQKHTIKPLTVTDNTHSHQANLSHSGAFPPPHTALSVSSPLGSFNRLR